MTKGLVIQGSFWPGREAPTPFDGGIEVNEGGEFYGTTTDCWGEASIWGEFTPGGRRLSFTKQYREGSQGEKKPIVYEFELQILVVGGHEFCLGWKGTYTIVGRDALNALKQTREASCLFFLAD